MKSLLHLTVRAKVLGRKGPSFDPVEIDYDGPFDIVRDLLTAIVSAEVERFKQRKEAARLLHVLTDREIEDGRAAGRILSGGQDLDERLPDAEQALQAAITAFDDGFYYMFLDETQVESLNQPMPPGDLAEVLFVRLTPLAGG